MLRFFCVYVYENLPEVVSIVDGVEGLVVADVVVVDAPAVDVLIGEEVNLVPNVGVDVSVVSWYLHTSSLVLNELHNDWLQHAEQAYAPPPNCNCPDAHDCKS